MAFRFDARADSSDDDENAAGFDLAAWKSGAAAKAKAPAVPPAPVAPIMGSRVEVNASEDEEDESRPSLSLQTTREPDRISAFRTRSPPVPSFRAINESAIVRASQPAAFASSSEPQLELDDVESAEEVEEEQEEAAGRPEKEDGHSRAPELFVQISQSEVDRNDYEDFTAGAGSIRRVLRKTRDSRKGLQFHVVFDDFHLDQIPYSQLRSADNGQDALDEFDSKSPPEEERDSSQPSSRQATHQRQRQTAWQGNKMSSTRPGRGKRQQPGFVSTVDYVDGSDAADSGEDTRRRSRRTKREQDASQYFEEADPEDDEEKDDMEDESEDELARSARRRGRPRRKPSKAAWTRNLRKRPASTSLTEDESEGSETLLQSDLPGMKRRKTKRSKADEAENPARQSERTTRHQANMQEREIDDIYRSASEKEQVVVVKPKLSVVKETFKVLPRNNDFRMRHRQFCDSCGNGVNYAPLIDCQGCSLSYHKTCLGHRTNREHLVTKIGEEDFVLQCRRCVGTARKKDPNAPDLAMCQDCRQHGTSCIPFRKRKSPNVEQKERDDNGGLDPTYHVDAERINNPENVLFRCTGCFRAFHFEHLPSRTGIVDMDVDAEQRFREYSQDWKCKECVEAPAKVSGLIAWKPLDEDSWDPAEGLKSLTEDDRVYLVRWEGMSYFRAGWLPGAWIWGVTTHMMRKAFAKRDDARHPKMRTEDAIPEDYLRTDIVLDIKFTSIVDVHTEDIDKARIREVKEALIKYKGLTYEDAVWEAPPGPDDGERWTDFVMAYNDWVARRYVRQPKAGALKARLEKVRKEDFRNLEKREQPLNLEGGKLMEYQLQGLNWLYYKWFTQKNAILADEMGLGKTIQIIGFLASLIQEHQCWPFLVVVPNSTCPNWRREIKRWAPSLRVVAYYGSKESKDLAYRHELYPDGAKDLRCHVVVTSYEAAADESCRKFFRGVPWQGLIVDEGQRLKNENTLLYSALGAMKAPFKILLTGTPLQNNTRELFNLLHFLDESYNPDELEQKYQDLDQEKITQLHDTIRPFFLRRTKAQVLTFLPTMSQIIVPVSMSLVQKKLYRSILAKNPDLMRAIFSTDPANLKQGERGSLSNILMQLRKCLCHPFVYNKSIEERNVDVATTHRNLVDASSKLMLLEVLLPKLKERGHRVLIFSQFLEMLDMVEDFLDGMQLRYQRLDGSIDALTKQKRIDEFNAPGSALFAFLLSTRAGSVGINLATADTVIILDPDFNPHQDIQALSRAHRIGQQKKVLCFQVVTRASAEERIMQIGRKKLALDHVLIQELAAEDGEQNDLVSVLRHGTQHLFEDNGEHDIVYDNASVDRLIDRSHMEDTTAGADKSAETQFSFARVWANDQGALEDAAMPVDSADSAPDPGVWANILKERERMAAQEAAEKAEAFGRGRRARANNIDYTAEGTEGLETTPIKRRKRKDKRGSESDTDFQDDDSDDEEDAEGEQQMDGGDLNESESQGTKPITGRKKLDSPAFRRAIVPKPPPIPEPSSSQANNDPTIPVLPPRVNCRACHVNHPVGSCPLKLAGVEHCNLCGIAHFGHARVCPHIQSETQVRAMLEALKYSNEPKHLVNEAKRYLRGLKGNLVQLKKQREQKELAAREAFAADGYQRSVTGQSGIGGGGGGGNNNGVW